MTVYCRYRQGVKCGIGKQNTALSISKAYSACDEDHVKGHVYTDKSYDPLLISPLLCNDEWIHNDNSNNQSIRASLLFLPHPILCPMLFLILT